MSGAEPADGASNDPELVPWEDYRSGSPRFAEWCETTFGPPTGGLVDPEAVEELRAEYAYRMGGPR